MIRRPSQGEKAPKDRQRGAVLVEAALTLPLFFLLIFAIIEFGFVFRDYVALTGSTNEGIRAASIGGNDLDADHHILEVLLDASSPLEDGSIQTIVIFKANGPGDTVPPNCLITSQDTALEQCNTYDISDFSRPLADFGCDPLQGLDEYWCPNERDVTTTSADYIGVHVVLQRNLITGIFGDAKRMTATEILRIEPRDL